MITIVFVLIIMAVLTIFLVQNAAPVAVSFIFWRFESSLAIVIFLSVLAGVVITAIIVFSGRIKQYIKRRN